MTVHNHGTEEGQGLGCRESLVDGKLVGECLLNKPEPEDQGSVNIKIVQQIPLEPFPYYIGICCQEWPLALGHSPGRCGECGQKPTFLRRGPVLDQGASPASVGYSAVQDYPTAPFDSDEARRVYDEASKEDPWPSDS